MVCGEASQACERSVRAPWRAREQSEVLDAERALGRSVREQSGELGARLRIAIHLNQPLHGGQLQSISRSEAQFDGERASLGRIRKTGIQLSLHLLRGWNVGHAQMQFA